jgi:predicted TIM-barrel fold metal-dependent hydrolase
MSMTGHAVIDVDGHVFEPDELWVRHLPRRLHEQRPRLVHDDRGTTRYLIEGKLIPPGTGVGAWAPEGIREASVHRDGAVDAKLRLEDMDTEGIDVAVLYGVIALALYNIEDRELGVACCRAYNDWLHEYCQADPARLKATPSLPLRWIDDAVVEAQRTVDELGFVSLTVPCAVGGRNPDDNENDPLFSVAEELGVPIGFHAGGVGFAHRRFTDAYATLHAIEFPFELMFVATTVVCGGVLDRHPRLRVALLEGGAGWVPFLFERLDEHYEHRAGEMVVKNRPSEYLAEGRLFVSTEGEGGLPQVVEQSGHHWLVWASDYPHWDSEFPDSVSKVTGRRDLSDGQKQALFQDNPRRLFGW